MTKSTLYSIPALLAAMSLASCSSDDPVGLQPDRSEYPAFMATIAGSGTRAANTSWDRGDKIGISGASRDNVCHITEVADGRFTVDSSDTQIYFQDEDEVTFTAYYPWSADALQANTRNQSADNQKKYDYLWAQAKGKKASPNVTFRFSHRMAKVQLTLRPGEGMTYDEVKKATLSIGGFRHEGTFNKADGTVTATGTATDKWIFTDGTATAALNDTEKSMTYSMILCPQTFTAPLTFRAELDLPGDKVYNLNAKIDFTNANSEIDGASAKNEWVAGRQYNISLALHKTGVSINDCKIDPWNEVTGNDIVVD